MSITGPESLKVKKLAERYNMIASLFWTTINLIPVSVFWYTEINLGPFYIFLIISVFTVLLPKAFFNSIPLGSTTSGYKKMGVHLLNKFTQNGGIINGLVRKKYPRYRVVSVSSLSMKKALNQTYMFEKFHFIMFTFFTLTTVYALAHRYVFVAVVISITNLFYNVYPIFLQHYVRIKLASARKRPANDA